MAANLLLRLVITMHNVNICWFRRDLRLTDNAALYHALSEDLPVVPIFIFDKNILDQLEDRNDRRVQFIYDNIEAMQEQLKGMGSSMEILHGRPDTVFEQLMVKYHIHQVFANEDYEPYALERDGKIERLLQSRGIALRLYKDQVIFSKNDILKDNGEPYTVFTPYSRKWKSTLDSGSFKSFDNKSIYGRFYQQAPTKIPSLEDLGFSSAKWDFPTKGWNAEGMKEYADRRNYPGIRGTSRLSTHLRFGTISIRKLAAKASELSETFLNELIWREFYQMICWHFPRVGKGLSFKAEYDLIPWRNNEEEFIRWCEGATGYPIVDAGMRELNTTGYMHNRVRMITASFLSKHLLIDWRWGEAYFAAKLLDFDFASNNGGWQWASGSGCDAAPYFRIFSPGRQAEKFDKDQRYTRTWVPELDSPDYPTPIVDHEFARKRCLQVYQSALRKDQ